MITAMITAAIVVGQTTRSFLVHPEQPRTGQDI